MPDSTDPGRGRPSSGRERDGELLHHEVRSLLERLNAGATVATVENSHTGQEVPHPVLRGFDAR